MGRPVDERADLMQALPPALLRALTGAVRRRPVGEWSNDGGQSWSPLAVGAADVKPDRTAECRWSATVELLDPPVGAAGINTVATQVRLFEELTTSRADPYRVPAGRYVVDSTKRTLRGRGLSAELLGVEDIVRGAALPVARTVETDTAEAIAQTLIAEAAPWAAVAWREGVKADTKIPSFVIDEDRWQGLSGGADQSGVSTGIAPALGAEVFADARGVFTFAPVPTLADPAVWTLPYGQGLIEPEAAQSSEGLVNVWVISGEEAAGASGSAAAPVGPVYVWDDDPMSLTYAGPDPVRDPLAPQREGLAWVRPRVERYTSPLITSEEQAYTAGRAKLADSLRVQSTLTFTAYAHPGIEPGDVVCVEVEPNVWETHLIDACPRTLGAASMSCQTRTSARRI
ncbi:phage tail protein [Streptomyces sp. NPDC005918]|uniref:phage tail protein n=1 Tax=Streptomyces sp. NPDC005918 TaxID=3155454 RepID=UPI0033FC5B13